MRVVHEIFHAISEGNEGRFRWKIHISTKKNGKVFKIIACLDSYVNETTIPVIQGTPMWVFNFFQLLSNKRCSHEEFLFKGNLHWEIWPLKLYPIFCLCFPILLYGVLDYMLFMVDTDAVFTLDDTDIEELLCFPFLEGIVKQVIKFFDTSFR